MDDAPARELEALLRVADVARVLGIARQTVYRIPWLWQRVIYVGPRSPRWEPADIELYKRLNKGAPRRQH